MSQEHTPGPWRLDFDVSRINVIAEDGGLIARLPRGTKDGAPTYDDAGAIANARRVVQCVNAHDGLVAALRAAEAALPEEKMLSVGNAMKQEEAGRIVRAALANLSNATGTAANQTEGK